jgi:hypothetical protein
VKIIIKPGNGTLEVSIPDIAVKTRALRVIVELDSSVAEVTPANSKVKLKTPRGEYYLRSVKVAVKDIFSVKEKPPEVIIHNALYVY